MKPTSPITHVFTDLVPSEREEGKIYVSIKYRTAVHNCFCGCGNKVVTPIKPSDWHLGFNGDSVSLWPSVGNWNFPCRSHYWIRNGQVIWAEDMPDEWIKAGRAKDQAARETYFGRAPAPTTSPLVQVKRRSFWTRLLGLK